jgi:hypothetical protein
MLSDVTAALAVTGIARGISPRAAVIATAIKILFIVPPGGACLAAREPLAFCELWKRQPSWSVPPPVNGLEEFLSGGRVISWLAVTGYPGGWPADLPGVFRAW